MSISSRIRTSSSQLSPRNFNRAENSPNSSRYQRKYVDPGSNRYVEMGRSESVVDIMDNPSELSDQQFYDASQDETEIEELSDIYGHQDHQDIESDNNEQQQVMAHIRQESLCEQFECEKYQSNDQQFIPFSEFIKEKQKSGKKMPSETTRSQFKLTHQKVYDPNEPNTHKKLEAKIRMLENSANSRQSPLGSTGKATSNDKYFSTLKNKFSPLSEIQRDTRQQESMNMSSSIRQSPNQLNASMGKRSPGRSTQQTYYHNKFPNEPTSPRSHRIKSEEQSKKAIKDLANQLKKKLQTEQEYIESYDEQLEYGHYEGFQGQSDGNF